MIRPLAKPLLIAAIALPGLFGSGMAQERPQAPGSTPCVPQERLLEEQDQTQSRDERDGGGLSKRLALSEGVICPPDVGPDIRLKPPDTGTTPVIPPPDVPGNQPK